MNSKTKEKSRFEVLGLREGWLYLRRRTQMLRLSPWPAVTLESRAPTGSWGSVSDDMATEILPRVHCARPSFT